jgi:hypothetical protein
MWYVSNECEQQFLHRTKPIEELRPESVNLFQALPPEARGRKPEARSQRPEARCQRPEARGQRPEAGSQKPDVVGAKNLSPLRII